MVRYILTPALIALTALLPLSEAANAAEPPRDLTWFLQRLRSVDHLPELEDAHTAMSSTWDRAGGNADGADFKRIEKDGRNILLDVDGPGCIHRIFTGVLLPVMSDTRLQVFFDNAEKPSIDVPVLKFFDDTAGPLPYPLVFFKSYPGTLFPIPYAKHCRVQLVNRGFGRGDWKPAAWGNYWQITYTTYPPATEVKTLQWPPSADERREIDRTSRAWLKAESTPPDPPASPAVDKSFALASGASETIAIQGCGVIRQFRMSVEPPTADVLLGLRLQIAFDGAEWPSVDAPVGLFFGNAYAGGGRELASPAAVLGRRPGGIARYSTDFSSLLLGAKGSEAYSCFPMPFRRGASIRLSNQSKAAAKVRLRLDVERRDSLPDNWGVFHATSSAGRAATEATPKFGPQNVPCHVVLDRRGRGKYVGVMLSVDWPSLDWWGEGDWLIWSDEDGWPPSYHGTGSEEYFNSGWCQFDRKAVSGFVTLRPGHPMVYAFHLNDAFQFQRSVRVVEEQMGAELIATGHPLWSTTAYWYALPARPAESTGTSWPASLTTRRNPALP
jgi:hypothetical protein